MKAGRHEGDFAHSLTDLMSGVAVMFLVVAAIFMVQASQAKKKALTLAAKSEIDAKKNEDLARKYTAIDLRDQQGIQEIETLHDRLAGSRGVELKYDKKVDPRLLTIVFNRDSLRFESGACDVGLTTLASLRATLQDIFPKICTTVETGASGLQKSIALEGHTDNEAPLGVSCKGVAVASACFTDRKGAICRQQGFESNVLLSAARAQFVFFQARDVLKDNDVVAKCLDRNFMVAGRGPMDPLDGGTWDTPRIPEENDKNRRVVIKVRVMVASVDSSTP